MNNSSVVSSSSPSSPKVDLISNVTKQRINELNGRTISINKKEGSEKVSDCWDSIGFEQSEVHKELIGKDSFISEPENSEDLFGNEIQDDLFGENPTEDLVESFKITNLIKQQSSEFEFQGKQEATEGSSDVLESLEDKTKNLEEKITSEVEKKEYSENLENVSGKLEKSFENFLINKNYTYQDPKQYEADLHELQQTLINAPSHKHEELTNNFINKIIDKGKIGKLENGKFVPLSQQEKEELKKELKGFFKDFFVQYPIATKTELKFETLFENRTKSTKDPETYIVAHYTPEKIIFSQQAQVQVIERTSDIAKIIIDIIKKASAERKEEERKDLRERIVELVIKDEILKTEILKSEVKLQNLKFEINKTFNMPLEVRVKLIKVINNLNHSINIESATLTLPGLHKVRSLLATTA